MCAEGGGGQYLVQVSPSHPINHGDWTPQPVTLIPPFATPCVLVSNVLNGVIKVAHNCDVQAVLLPEEYRLFKN